jgi:hypothetical protein
MTTRRAFLSLFGLAPAAGAVAMTASSVEAEPVTDWVVNGRNQTTALWSISSKERDTYTAFAAKPGERIWRLPPCYKLVRTDE